MAADSCAPLISPTAIVSKRYYSSTEHRHRASFSSEFLDIAREQGLLMLPSGTHSVRIRPPLDVRRDFADLLVAAIDRALTTMRQ